MVGHPGPRETSESVVTDDVETRALFDQSLESERALGVRIADEIIEAGGAWRPVVVVLAHQLKEQRRVTEVLRRQMVIEVAG